MASDQHLDWALRYAARGWAVLPLEERSKEPNGRLVPHGLKDASKDPAVITRWWAEYPQANIGIVTGEVSGLCVLDVDPAKGGDDSFDKLALRYGKPNTATSLTGGGGHHYLFAANGARIRNSAGKLGPGLDVRGEGGYIVAPPSIHPRTGLRYEWEGSSDPMEGFPLADSAFLTLPLDDTQPQRAAPTNGGSIKEGGRNQHLASLAGTMRRRGMSATAIEQALLAENIVHCDPPLGDSEVRQIAHSVSRYEPETQGCDASRRYRDEPENGGDTGEVFEEATDEDGAQAEKGPVPPRLLMIPGVLGQAVNYILETAPKPQPVFAVQGALALGALACGRRYRSENDNFTNLWIAIVGPSGSGKEHVQGAIRRLMDTAGMGDAINHGGYTSQGGITSALMDHPNHLSIMDEFGKHMEAICLDHGSAHLKTMMKVLMELYGRAADYYAPQQYSTMGVSEEKAEALKVRIEHPCLTLLATTTPGALYRNLSEASIEDGFMPRFILRETDVVLRGFRTKLRDTPPPPALIGWIRDVQNQFNGPADHALAPDRIKGVRILDEGWAVFEDLENRIVDLRNDNKEISELFNRTLENAMRVATIVAASVSAQNPEIDGEVAGWSAEYLLDASLRMLEIAKRFGRDSEWAQSQNKIIAFIRKYPDGTTQRRLCNFCRAYRNLKPADRQAIIANLLEAGSISIERRAVPGGVSTLIRPSKHRE